MSGLILFTLPPARADKETVTLWLALFLLQDPKPSQAESLARQRASVQRQAKSSGTKMIPWTPATASAPVERE